MGGREASALLGLPVRIRGIELGHPVGVLIDSQADRLLGLELLCGDGGRRFLPFAVAQIRPDEIEVASVLALIDESGLGYYRRHSRRLSDLALAEPWIDDDGAVHEARTAA
jgi:hypothetical protein